MGVICSKQPANRTVKTLLLCKLKPDRARELNGGYYSSQYNNLYTGPLSDGAKYITMGNVDAISIYNTVDAAQETPNWFRTILEDRKTLIQKTNSDINYHPIHLVANRKYDSCSQHRAFCVVSLIYGIFPDENDAFHWTNILSEAGLSEISNYEAKLHNFYSHQPIPANTTYEIYNAVNICDAVIVWNTDNLLDTLKLSGLLNHLGFARKTFTLVGFRWDDEKGRISNRSLDLLQMSPEVFSVRVQGSIRNQAAYQKVIENAKKSASLEGISLQNTRDYIVCGQSDFSVLLPDIDGTVLSWLLNYYLCDTNNTAISNACWEIHTELMYKPDDSTSLNLDNDPYSILNSFFYKSSSVFSSMSKYPWFSAFYELLCVHANIDRHPILYGPGYCIFNFLYLSFSYFENCSNPQIDNMLTRSKDYIQEFIRGWSSFTDQLLRIDDLVFHGFGNSTALYSTLPECALDFYHSLILSVVNLLIDVDQKANRIGSNRKTYVNDFLLLPTLDRGVSIMPMFDVDDYPHENPTDIRILWPEKQAFLVYFPIETVFSPVQFFAPLVHECFHYFGDACRKRERRFKFVCWSLAGLIVDALGHNTDSPKDTVLCESVAHALWNDSEPLHMKEPNEQQTRDILNHRLHSMFCEGGFSELCDRIGLKSLFYERTAMIKLQKWSSYCWIEYTLDETSFSSSSFADVTKNCMDYFKECYADLMMILILKLHPLTYLNLFQNDVNNAAVELPKYEKARTAQRIALVFASLSSSSNPDWQENEIEDALSKIHLPDGFSKVIKWCFHGLTDQNESNLDHGIPEEPLERVFPMLSLKIIMGYLEEVCDEFKKLFLNDADISKRLYQLQQDFKDIFIDGKFLSKRYFEIIHQEHEAIRTLKTELDGQNQNLG